MKLPTKITQKQLDAIAYFLPEKATAETAGLSVNKIIEYFIQETERCCTGKEGMSCWICNSCRRACDAK